MGQEADILQEGTENRGKQMRTQVQSPRLISFSPEEPRTIFPMLVPRAGRPWGEHLAPVAVTQLQLRDGEKDTASEPEPGPCSKEGVCRDPEGKTKVTRDFSCWQVACLQESGAQGPQRKQPLRIKDLDHDSWVSPNSSTDLGLWV